MRLLTRTITVAVVSLAAAGVFAAAAKAAGPTDTSPPTITGTQEQGKTLTATRGAWSGNPTTFFYRWQRCAANGSGCTNIDNAVGKTYTLTAADVDQSVRVVVTASNADGQTSANSQASDVISATTSPKNTAKPTVAGTTQPGEELTADPGSWTGGVRSYAFQWQRCDSTGVNCTDVAGASGRTYGVRGIDVDHTLRVEVTATNLAGSASAASDTTGVVRTAEAPPLPRAAVNRRPTIAILGVRFLGARVYVRFRTCDDSRRNLHIGERDSKPRVPSYTRRFRTLAPPRSCAALTRSWRPAPRFRHGRYIVTLWARDAFGLTSRPAYRSFFR